MRTFLHAVIDDEGEGVILRKPASLYEHGRNESLLKLKVIVLVVRALPHKQQSVRGDREGMVLEAREDRSLILQLYEVHLLIQEFL